jgi:hypothetical protein
MEIAILLLLIVAKATTGGRGPVCPPLRQSGQHLDDAVMSRYLRDALKTLSLEKPGLGWYGPRPDDLELLDRRSSCRKRNKDERTHITYRN